MPTLYTMPGTCSLACNVAVAWVDAPIDVHNLAYGDHKKDAYLAVNRKGKVPALKFEDGDVLTELPAIMSYIGAEYGGKTSGEYARDEPLGRKEIEALSWMSAEVHSAYGPHFAPQRFAKSESAQGEVKEATYNTLRGHYERMNEIFGDGGKADWYLGKKSFADAFLYVLTRWIDQTPLSLDDYPRLRDFRHRMEKDEGVRTALQRQDMKPAA